VEEEALISRPELTAMLFALADINVNVDRIVDLLEGDGFGEEGLSEEDS
jgi:hypothetical protein